jgi:transposase
MKTVYYIGLDVHKDTIQMAVLDNKGKEPVSAKGLGSDPMEVIKAIGPYQTKGSKVITAYEAGCLGYTLYRKLEVFGVECRVIAPQKVFHGSAEKIKTDKRDAIDIAWMLRRNEGESIAIPSEQDEATRDMIRCRGDFQDDLKRSKQRMLKFLLRKGIKYETDRYWTGKHMKWLRSQKFKNELEQLTFDNYLAEIDELSDRTGRLDDKIKEVAQRAEYKEKVQKFRAFRGIDYLIALSLVVEIEDFRRFPTAGSLMSYLGLVPTEDSSGKKRKQGGITKTGNCHLRRLLTEAAQHYARPVQVSKRLRDRRKGTDEAVIAYADKAMARLHGKFTHLVFAGKPRNTAITAVARELTGFIWGVMNKVAA